MIWDVHHYIGHCLIPLDLDKSGPHYITLETLKLFPAAFDKVLACEQAQRKISFNQFIDVISLCLWKCIFFRLQFKIDVLKLVVSFSMPLGFQYIINYSVALVLLSLFAICECTLYLTLLDSL